MNKAVFRPLKKVFRRFYESMGFVFYTHPQTYRVIYRVILHNPTFRRQSGFLVVPIPSETLTQQFLAKPSFSSSEVLIQKESQFGNSYATWTIDLAPDATALYEEKFEMRVAPEGIEGATMDPRLQEINDFVIATLEYGDPIPGLYSAEEALKRRRVDCGGFGTLFCARCQEAGIQARLVSGFWAGYPKNEMHAWVEALSPEGQWIPADPSVEQLLRQGRTRKSGRLGFAGSDRIALSFGHYFPILIDGRTVTVDILQNPMVVPREAKEALQMTSEFITSRA
ncbi:transglutaminase domain-containing protein [Candidatus Peregrinibacteria bacterium]|nr:transglutaminase domain-containing protein [Candidatus Peregrinibacteria bacterium]